MKIRLRVSQSGTHNGASWPARGEVADIADVLAARMVANGQAEYVTVEPAVEAAVESDDIETARDALVPRRRARKG